MIACCKVLGVFNAVAMDILVSQVCYDPLVYQLPTIASPPIDPLDVEGIYTYRAKPAGTDAVSIDVVVFPVKRNRHPLIPVVADAAAQPAAANRRLQPSRP